MSEPLTIHTLPLASLRAIAAGRAGRAEWEQLRAAQHSLQLLVLRSLLDGVRSLPRRTFRSLPSAEEGWAVLARSQAHAPGTVEHVISDPFVRTWALRLLRRLGGVPGLPLTEKPAPTRPLWVELGRLHALAAAAAISARLPAHLTVPVVNGRLWLPGLGAGSGLSTRRWSLAEVTVLPEAAVLEGEDARVVLPRRPSEAAPGWQPLPVLACTAGLPGASRSAHRILFDTLSPYRNIVPGKPVGRPGPPCRELWRQRTGEALRLAAAAVPGQAGAVAQLVTALVPLPSARTGTSTSPSASSSDAFGAVAAALPRDAEETAAMLIHEARHQALNAILDMVPLLHTRTAGDVANGESDAGPTLFYSPWRRDPRPPLGLLHGTFAFAGVADFWRAHRDQVRGRDADRANFEFATAREQVLEGTETLLDGDLLTAPGKEFINELMAMARGWTRGDHTAITTGLALDYCTERRAGWLVAHRKIREGEAARLAHAWLSGGPVPSTLPEGKLREGGDTASAGVQGAAVRLRLTAPARYRRLVGSGVVDPAAAAAAEGRRGDAREIYRARISADPHDVRAWFGFALSFPPEQRSPGIRLVLDRPELVTTVFRSAAGQARGRRLPDPLLLADWLAGQAPAAGQHDGRE